MGEQEEIRRRLTERRAEIEERLGRVAVDVRHGRQPLDADFEEQAVERENDEVLAALDDSMRAELAQLDAALARVERGEYGVCESCGQQIAAARLAALPYAVRCVRCAER
jgi:DnaK suppressor protein